MPKKKFSQTRLVFISLLIALLMGEVLLRIAVGKLGLLKLDLVDKAIYESFLCYYSRNSLDKLEERKSFDRLLGWRSIEPPSPPPPTARCTKNREGWRSVNEYAVSKKKKRVAVVGDSYINYCHHDDSELITTYLQKNLGSDVEVMNFGVPGFGTDQMTVLATEVLPEYQPDWVVFAFIQNDLYRSCGTFIQDIYKPFYRLENGKAVLKGVPVRTEKEIILSHDSWSDRVKDAATVLLTRPQWVKLVGQVLLNWKVKLCVNQLNPALFDLVEGALPKTKILFTYLEGGKIPQGVETALLKRGEYFLNADEEVGRISKILSLEPGHLAGDGHPDARLNQIYAYALSERIGRLSK